MTLHRLPDYLEHMRQAIADAQSFTEGMTQADFMQDKRTHCGWRQASYTDELLRFW